MGQVAQPRPDSVARTTPPSTIKIQVATAVAAVNRR